MPQVSVGSIWQVNASKQIALVVFVRDAVHGRPEDVRVVPVHVGEAVVGLATHRDIVVPPTENSFGERLLLACWNARGLSRSDLQQQFGQVSASVVDAARTAEMAGLVPGLDIAKCRGWLGPRPVSDEAYMIVSEFQVDQAAAWDALEQDLVALRSHAGQVFSQAEYKTVAPSRILPVETTNDTGHYGAAFTYIITGMDFSSAAGSVGAAWMDSVSDNVVVQASMEAGTVSGERHVPFAVAA